MEIISAQGSNLQKNFSTVGHDLKKQFDPIIKANIFVFNGHKVQWPANNGGKS
jgi:uncharacterized phage-like protein YoqJ